MNKKGPEFAISIPPGMIYASLAVYIVYGTKMALVMTIPWFVGYNILEKFLGGAK